MKQQQGLKGLTPILKEVLLWLKCYQTSLPATEKSFVKERVNPCGRGGSGKRRSLTFLPQTTTPHLGGDYSNVHGVRVCSNFIDLHVVVQLSQHHLLKRLSFSHFIFLLPLLMIN